MAEGWSDVILVDSTEAPMNATSSKISLGLTALLAVLLFVPFAAEAKPPKKPNNKKPKPNQQQPAPAQEQPTPQGEPAQVQQSPPAGIDGVDEKLWRYQTGEARGVLGRFMDQADKNAYVALASGRVLDQEKKYGEAEAQIRKATEMVPSDPAPFAYLGELYRHQGRNGDADNAFRKAADVARAKGGSESAYYLGVAQQHLKQYDEAVATLQGARAPQSALVPYQIGVTRYFQGNWDAAVEQLNNAINMDSGLAYAYYYRALAQDKKGRKDQLVNDMGRFLALAPNAPEAGQAKAILNSVKR
jgi:tetratricopeptide (TPR) repeat protein